MVAKARGHTSAYFPVFILFTKVSRLTPTSIKAVFCSLFVQRLSGDRERLPASSFLLFVFINQSVGCVESGVFPPAAVCRKSTPTLRNTVSQTENPMNRFIQPRSVHHCATKASERHHAESEDRNEEKLQSFSL